MKWQSDVGGDSSRLKTFRQEILQQLDIIAFAFMRPGSIYIQVMHSPRTFSHHGGDPELRGHDFAFVGDRDLAQNPNAVSLDDKMWKWVSKQMVLNITVLDLFYANPGNATKLYRQSVDTTGEEQDVAVPRLLLLPPALIIYCIAEPRTPYALFQFIMGQAACDTSDITISDCALVLDWCIVASHRDSNSTTRSMLAIALQTAPTHDTIFCRWLQKILDTTLGTQAASTAPSVDQQGQAPQVQRPPQATQPEVHQPTQSQWLPPPPPLMPVTQPFQMQSPLPAAPVQPGVRPISTPPHPQDMWAQFTASISQSFASAAASMNPAAPRADGSSAYEEGGKNYDEFQLAVLRGFAHTHMINFIPPIWPMFQYSKHIDSHRDNLRRKMIEWSVSITPTKPDHVMIERGLYFPTQVMRDILALRFNPGGPTADVSTASKGMSILVCRSLTEEQKSALRQREINEGRSKRKTLAELEHDGASETIFYPDDFNELHRCLGTYCALLHTLFGDRCVFYKHCLRIWTSMNSDLVFEKRRHFTPSFCRQIVWAIIEDGRAYFAHRLTVDNFLGVHPDDITYPRSDLIEIDHCIRRGSPIIRASFPMSWSVGSHTPHAGALSAHTLPTIITGVQTPSVVSGVTTGTAQTRRTGQTPTVNLRTTDIHPAIHAVMGPYLQKIKSVKLTAMLNHVNLTMDDLPTLTPQVSGATGICYNYILGHCTHPDCRHKDGHVKATDVTDEFATDIITKLRPAITEFTATGAPRRKKRRRAE